MIEIFNKGRRSFLINDLNSKQTKIEKGKMYSLDDAIAEKLINDYPRDIIMSSEKREAPASVVRLQSDNDKLKKELEAMKELLKKSSKGEK